MALYAFPCTKTESEEYTYHRRISANQNSVPIRVSIRYTDQDEQRFVKPTIDIPSETGTILHDDMDVERDVMVQVCSICVHHAFLFVR